MLSLSADAIDRNDIATSQVDSLMIGFGGAFTGTPVEGLKKEVLIKSTTQSQLVEGFLAQMSGEAIVKDFKPSSTEYALAIKLSGKFKTAFPNGRPDAPPAPGEEKKEAPKGDALKESKDANHVILVGDEARIRAVAPALRAFELMLLREMGVLPSLQLQTLNMQAVQASGHYDLVPEAGLRDCGASQAWEDQRHRLMGNHWLALQEALQGEHAFAELVRLLAQWSSEDRSALQQQLRVLVHHHCGMDVLKTRQLMMDLQSL